MATKKKIKKRLIILGSFLLTFITAVIIFLAITGIDIKTLIMSGKSTGSKVDTNFSGESISLETPNDGSKPSDYDALTNFAYFSYKLEHSEFEATTNGSAQAKGMGDMGYQDVYDYRLKSGNYYLMDTRSTGKAVKVFQEQFFTPNKVLYRKSSSSSDYDKQDVGARSTSQQFSLYGYGPDKTIGYIVSSETIKSQSEVKDNGDGTYTITLDLMPTKAPVYYQNKVKTNASSPDYPNFLSVSLEYTFDDTWTIKTGHYMEVYSVHKGVWAETYTDITETFTYLTSEEASNKISEKYNFYKSYFDLEVPSDDEINNTAESPLDYLATMANLLNEDKLYAKAVLEVNDKNILVKAAIDIKNKTIDATIGDANIVFKDNKLYLMGNVKGYYDINTLVSMLGLESEDSNTNEFTLPFDTSTLIEGVMSDINNGSVTKSDKVTYVDITFNLFGLSIPTTFTFATPDENTVEFSSLEATYIYQNDVYKLSFEFIDAYETTNTQYAIELAYAVDLNLNTTITYNSENYNLVASIYLDLKNKVVEGNVNLSNDKLNLDASIYLKDNYLYVIALDKIYAKISLDEIKTLINDNKSNLSLESFDKSKITYDLIKSYLENINISFTKNLSITYDNTIELGDIKLSNTTFSVSTRGSYKDVVIPDKEYINYADIKDTINNIVDKATEIKNANGMSLNLDFVYKTYHINALVNMRFDNLSLKATLNISSNDFSADILVTYLGDTLYIDYNNLHVSITKDKLISTIEEFNLASNNTIDLNEILNILKSITYKDSLQVSLNTKDYINCDLVVSLNNDLTLSIKGENISGSITNVMAYSDSITINSQNYTDLSSYVDNGIDIYNIIKTKIFNINIDEFTLTYGSHEILIGGSIYVNNKNVDAKVNITIDSKYEINALIKVVDNILYVTVSNQTFKIDLNNLESFINSALEKINGILNTNYSFDLNNSIELKQIIDVISSLTIDDNIELDLESLIGKTLTVVIYLTTSDTTASASVKTDGEVVSNVKVTLTNSTSKEIDVPTANLIDEDDILTLLDYAKSIKTLYDKKLFNLNINELVIQKSNGNYFNITGSLKINFVNGLSDFDATANLIIIEYRNQSQYGWHQINLDIMSSVTTGGEAMVYGTYGNNESNKDSVVKVYTTFTGVKNLINSITNLLKIETFKNLIEDDAMYLDINNLVESLIVGDDTLTLSINQTALNKNFVNESRINVALTKNSERLTNVEVSNAYVSYENDTNYTKISSIDIELNEIESLTVIAPSDMSGYINLTNMSYLFEALYNDAQLKYFEIKGNVVLNVSLGSIKIKDVNVPVDIKIHVDDNGKPEVFASLSIPSVTVALVKLLTQKTLNIYYYDGYVYLNRIGTDAGGILSSKDKDEYLLKITLDEFMNNPLTYLLGDYGMGMPSTIMDAITSADSNGDGFVNAADCVNSASIGTNKFSFNLDIGEIADNSTLGDMDVTLTTSQIKNASQEEVAVLTTIEKFTLGFDIPVVSMTLSGSGLTLANIYDGQAHDLDMSALYTFVNNFNSKYEVNTKYKNGSVEGTI